MQGITYNVTASLRAMKVGQSVTLNPKTNETTVRNACARLKKIGVGVWVCEKRFVAGTDQVKDFKVTRNA